MNKVKEIMKKKITLMITFAFVVDISSLHNANPVQLEALSAKKTDI